MIGITRQKSDFPEKVNKYAIFKSIITSYEAKVSRDLQLNKSVLFLLLSRYSQGFNLREMINAWDSHGNGIDNDDDGNKQGN